MPGARRTLTTRRIVFLLVAAAAPLAAMVGNARLALRLSDGPGLPGAFALATIVLLSFSVGYGAMSRRVVNTGAFCTYVARGLSKPPALAVALVAVLSDNAMAIGSPSCAIGSAGRRLTSSRTTLFVSQPIARLGIDQLAISAPLRA